MKRPLLACLLLLSACGTPQEQCIGAGTRDLRVVDRLIKETEDNLARGYGYETVTIYEPRWVDCTPRPTAEVPEPKMQMCLDQVPVSARKEVALDLTAEAAKLDGLKAKRAQLSRDAQGLIAACKEKYPE